jgi:endonuclease-3
MASKKRVLRSAQDDSALNDIIRRLAEFHGPPPAPFPGDPFAMILWEQVAYLATDAKRRAAFDALETRVGLTPIAIARAKPATLTAIARLGGAMVPEARAERMVTSAELVLREHDGDLARVLALPLPEARAALAAFPMIGEPGADKILASCGAARLVSLDSNGLRVVTRLGFVDEAKDYRAWYRAARAAVTVPAGKDARWGADAGYLLRLHGQVTCKRTAPRCRGCVLREVCPSAEG